MERFNILHAKTAFLFLALVAAQSSRGQVVINEFMASNSLGLEDSEFSETSDWIELFNSGPNEVSLDGWYLTDNLSDSTKWNFPSGSMVAPGGFLLVWCDGQSTGLHASFKLSKSGEELGLYSDDLVLVDAFVFGTQDTDISRGRAQDGLVPWSWFQEPTPGAANNTSIAYEGVVHYVPHFSQRGGFFDSDFDLELDAIDGTIRYTTDGKEPSSTSPQFPENLSINSNTFLRARVFLDNQIPGPIVTNSFFFDSTLSERHLPVFSLVSDPDYFWDADTGIYVQDFKPDWEWPLNLEFFENDGNNEAAFNVRAGVKINGQNSWVLPQKMLGIYFRNGYGSGALNYPLFHDRDRAHFDNFVLRASGSDWSYTLMRDGIGQSLPQENSPVALQGFRPSIVFINGEYMGIHNIRSRVDEGFIEENYSWPSGSYDLILDDGIVEEGDLNAFSLMDALMNADLAIDENFNAAAAVMDFVNFTDYWATEIWTSNSSWGHNIVLCKPNDTGLWQFIFTDLDRGFTGSTDNDLGNFTNAQNNSYDYARTWIRHALENPAYADFFAQRFTDHLHTSFHPKRVLEVIQDFAVAIQNEIPFHTDRWQGTTSSYGDGIENPAFWQNEVEELRNFAFERNEHMLEDLASEFDLPPSVQLNTHNLPEGAGTIRLNNFEIPQAPWSGDYFPNMPFELTAQPLPGQEFVGWSLLEPSPVISAGSNWKFSDDGIPPPANWTSLLFNDSEWETGEAELGYGDGDESTTVSFGDDADDKHITTYFRKNFNFDSATPLVLPGFFELLRDDGAVVYLNGVELFRSNMPTGPIDSETTAVDGMGGSAESTWHEIFQPLDLNAGTNLIAVEIHQYSNTSADLSFDLSLSILEPAEALISAENPLSVTLSESMGYVARYASNGACVLPQEISEDLTLEASCSPYLAQGNSRVLPNVTLTLEPGVEVLMPSEASLVIEGQMLAEGTADSTIYFGLNPDYQAPWGHLQFHETTGPNLLRHVIIEDASDGTHPIHDRAAVVGWFSDLMLDNVELTNNHSNPVYTEYSQVNLTRSILHSDVTGDLINVRHGSGTVDSCLFIGNGAPDTDAIDFDHVESGSIRQCIIHSFYGENSDGIDLGEGSDSVFIEGGLIHHCTDKGISIGQISNAVIQDMTIANCALGVAMKDQSTAEMNHITFYGNQIAVNAYEKNVGQGGGWGTLQNTIISNSSDAPLLADSLSSILVMNSISDTDGTENDEIDWANPNFSDPDGFDFTLLENSPAIGAANDTFDLGTLQQLPGNERNIEIVEIGYAGLEHPNKEWIRLFNPGNHAVNMTGYSLSDAVEWTLYENFFLDPGASLWVVRDGSFFESAQDAVFQWQNGQLANEGERIVLSNATGMVMDFVRYAPEPPWPIPQLGNEALLLLANNLDNHFASSWTLGQLQHGSEVSSRETINAYPNPASSSLTITSEIPIQSCLLFNLAGQQINFPGQAMGLRTIQYDVSTIDAGVYMLRVNETSLPLIIHP